MPDQPKESTNPLKSWRGSLRKATSAPDLELGFHHRQATRSDELARNSRLNAKESTLTHTTRLSDEIPEEGPEQQNAQHYPELQNPNALEPQLSDSKPRKQATFPPMTPASAKKSLFAGAPKVADPDPAAERLNNIKTPLTNAQFAELIGIKQPTHPHQHPRELVIKGGLYHRIISNMKSVQWKYRVFDVMTYALLAVQLMLSSVFIVLGALGDQKTHLAIAVLGAVSAVVAGVLALMKGQGLPNRLRRYREGLQAVAFEVEELYWDVVAGVEVYFRDIKKIREDFLRIVDVAEKNHPDNWNSFTDQLAQTQGSAGSHGSKARQ